MPSMELLLARRWPWQLRFIVSDCPREPSGCTSAQCLSSSKHPIQPSQILYTGSPSKVKLFNVNNQQEFLQTHQLKIKHEISKLQVQWNLTIKVTHGLGKSDLNVEVTLLVLQGVICTVEYNLGLSQGS